MHERALRTVLLIQAIEETDRSGEVLPLTDRAEATRTSTAADPPTQPTSPAAPLPKATESFLVLRANSLLAQLRSRSPGIDEVLAVMSGAGLGRLMVVLALVFGLTLSVLDGGPIIDLFAWPLLVSILWNLVVYAGLITSLFKSHRETGQESAARDVRNSAANNGPDGRGQAGASASGRRSGSLSARLYERWMRRRVEALLHHSNRFNTPLAAGLRRFANDWRDIARPLLVLRARRLLHVAAAIVSLGYVIGVAIKGLILRYPAEWSGSILGPEVAHVLLVLVYGPASAISGIAIPSSEEITALRGTAVAGGNAGAWVELMAWTAVLYIVLPRLLAAVVTTVRLWTATRRPAVPAALSSYAQVLLAEARTAAPAEV